MQSVNRFFDLVEANRQREAVRQEKSSRKRLGLLALIIGAAALGKAKR